MNFISQYALKKTKTYKSKKHQSEFLESFSLIGANRSGIKCSRRPKREALFKQLHRIRPPKSQDTRFTFEPTTKKSSNLEYKIHEKYNNSPLVERDFPKRWKPRRNNRAPRRKQNPKVWDSLASRERATWEQKIPGARERSLWNTIRKKKEKSKQINKGLIKKLPVGKAVDKKLVDKVRNNSVHEIPTRHDFI